MRVISGSARGRRLLCPPGLLTRPTSDRAKSALFSMLGSRVAGACICDLFAGSGALGIEALSRGARRAVFVENNREAAAVLKKNLAAAGFLGSAEVVFGDALKYVKTTGGAFDIIFLDPPYGAPIAQSILGEILKQNILSEGAVITIETDNAVDLAGFSVLRDRRYGKSRLLIAGRE